MWFGCVSPNDQMGWSPFGAVILTRLLWIYPATYLPRFLFPAIRRRDPYPPWQGPTLLNPHFATGVKDQYGARVFYVLGDWMERFTYVELEDGVFRMRSWPEEAPAAAAGDGRTAVVHATER